MDNIYREHIIDHYSNPRNFGLPSLKPRKGERLVTVKEANASCGDMFELSVTLRQDSQTQKIGGVTFRGVGCAISTAAFSLLTERIMNNELGIEDLKRLSETDMVEMLGISVSPTRMKCATLPLRAVAKALKEL